MKQVVLNDIPDDAILIKVAASAFRAKIFAEDDLHITDEGATPERLKHQIGKAQHLQIHDHMTRQVHQLAMLLLPVLQ